MRTKPVTEAHKHGICCEWVRGSHIVIQHNNTDKCRLYKSEQKYMIYYYFQYTVATITGKYLHV